MGIVVVILMVIAAVLLLVAAVVSPVSGDARRGYHRINFGWLGLAVWAVAILLGAITALS